MNSADSISRSLLLALLNSKELTQEEIIALVKAMQPREVDSTSTNWSQREYTRETIWPIGLG